MYANLCQPAEMGRGLRHTPFREGRVNAPGNGHDLDLFEERLTVVLLAGLALPLPALLHRIRATWPRNATGPPLPGLRLVS